MVVETAGGFIGTKALSRIVGLSASDVFSLSRRAPKLYRPFDRRKNEGESKWRHIDNPTGVLKHVQRLIARSILRQVTLPVGMFGGVVGKSTRDAASLHVGQRCVVKIDLRSCFPRIHNTEVYRSLRRQLRLSADAASVLTKLLTLEHRLPQGSPASPLMANISMIPMHLDIAEFCERNGLNFSQWVDDLIISGSSAGECLGSVLRIIGSHSKEVAFEKLEILMSSERQSANGIVVNNGLSVPLETYQRARDSIFALRRGDQTVRRSSVRGLVSYVCAVNQAQGQRLLDLLDDFEWSDDSEEQVIAKGNLTRPCNGYKLHRRSRPRDAKPFADADSSVPICP